MQIVNVFDMILIYKTMKSSRINHFACNLFSKAHNEDKCAFFCLADYDKTLISQKNQIKSYYTDTIFVLVESRTLIFII